METGDPQTLYVATDGDVIGYHITGSDGQRIDGELSRTMLKDAGVKDAFFPTTNTPEAFAPIVTWRISATSRNSRPLKPANRRS